MTVNFPVLANTECYAQICCGNRHLSRESHSCLFSPLYHTLFPLSSYQEHRFVLPPPLITFQTNPSSPLRPTPSPAHPSHMFTPSITSHCHPPPYQPLTLPTVPPLSSLPRLSASPEIRISTVSYNDLIHHYISSNRRLHLQYRDIS